LSAPIGKGESCSKHSAVIPAERRKAREPGPKYPGLRKTGLRKIRIAGVLGSRIGSLGASRRSPSGMTAVGVAREADKLHLPL
jgi:hypothetical protein